MNLTRNKPLLGVVSMIGVAFIAWLAFGFFGIHAAFIDDEVSEAGPIFNNSTAEQDAIAATDEFTKAMDDATTNRTEADESMEDMIDDMAEDMAGDENEGVPGEIVTLLSGDFAGLSRYNIVGQAKVLNDGSEQRFLRFENFSADNGPDLKVYLRADSGDFVSLGPLKGNIGDQNYEIPSDIDLDVFHTVDIWCERFGVGFGLAPLA